MKWRNTNTHASYFILHIQSFRIIYLFYYFIAFVHTGADTFHILRIMYDILKRTSPFQVCALAAIFCFGLFCVALRNNWCHLEMYYIKTSLLCFFAIFSQATAAYHWISYDLNIWACKSCIWFYRFIVGQFYISNRWWKGFERNKNKWNELIANCVPCYFDKFF